MILGSVLGGLGAYLFQVVGTRALGNQAYAPIATLWTIQYLSWSIVLHSVETYVTREALSGRTAHALPRNAAARIWVWVGSVAAAVTAGAWAYRDRLFGGLDDLALVAGLTVLSFGGFVVVRGRFAGLARYKAYGVVSASESLIRLVLAIAVTALVSTTRALAWVLPLGAAAAAAGGWGALIGDRSTEAVAAQQVAPAQPRTGRFLALTTVANAAGQLLLAGGPLALLMLGASGSELSIFFVTTTAARVPVVLALSGVLSRLLPTFTRMIATSGPVVLPGLARRIAGGTLLVAVVGAALGAWVGGALVALLFGSAFTPPWWLASAAGGGVLLATGSMLLNQLLIAGKLEHRLPTPWVIALAVAIVTVAIVPGTPSWRVSIGFVAGETAALAGLLAVARIRVGDRRVDR